METKKKNTFRKTRSKRGGVGEAKRWRLEQARKKKESKILFELLRTNATHDKFVEAIKNGSDINIKHEGKSILSIAIKDGKVELVRLLLEKGADGSATDNDGRTALVLASARGNTEIVRLLLEKGADTVINDQDDKNALPILFAIEAGNKQMVELLLEFNADIDAVSKTYSYSSTINSYNHTPLSFAIEERKPKIVKLLIEKGAYVTKKLPSNRSAIIYVHKMDPIDRVSIATLLINKGADMNMKSEYGESAFFKACELDYTDLVRLYLREGDSIFRFYRKKGDVNITNRLDQTPLMYPSFRGNLELVRLLLNNNADVNKYINRDNRSRGYIHSGFTMSVRLGFTGFTALDMAVIAQNTEIVRLLLAKGAHTKKRGSGPPINALIWASRSGNEEMVRMLLDKGADVAAYESKDSWYGSNPVDDYNSTALVAACWNGHREIARLLLEKRANIEQIASHRWTPLLAACRNGHIHVVRLLLEKGADKKKSVYFRSYGLNDPSGDQTPISVAKKHGHNNIVKLLKGQPIGPPTPPILAPCMTDEEYKTCDKQYSKDDKRYNEDDKAICGITQDELERKNAVKPDGPNNVCFEREQLATWLDINPIHPITKEPINKKWRDKNLIIMPEGEEQCKEKAVVAQKVAPTRKKVAPTRKKVAPTIAASSSGTSAAPLTITSPPGTRRSARISGTSAEPPGTRRSERIRTREENRGGKRKTRKTRRK